MKTLLEQIANKNYTVAEEALKDKLSAITKLKLHEMRKMIAARMSESDEKSEFKEKMQLKKKP